MNIQIKRKITSKISSDEIVLQLLKDRKIKDSKNFLNPADPYNIRLKDFFSQKTYKGNWNKTITLLEKLYKLREMIIVYTDYDADGITGGAILWETLYLLGFNAMPYVPDRKKEGYGFSLKGIDNAIKLYNPSLVISVDHGIVAEKEIQYLQKKNIPVIITDHHQKGGIIPNATAIFHTDQLSGSGLAYFFAKELYIYFQQSNPSIQLRINNKELEQLRSNFHSDYLALATIGSIADMISLVGLSRCVVYHGLKALTNTRRVGIRNIFKEAGIEGKQITPYEVGFIIAPRINAFGRLENAIEALRLLCTNKKDKAIKLALKAGKTNKLRQDLVTKAIEDAEKQVNTDTPIIICISKNWEEGIIGLIASKLCEKYYKPALALTKNDGIYKGSARSIEGVNILKLLRSCRKYLRDVGGHISAAGFTVEKEKLKPFVNKLQKEGQKAIKKTDTTPKITVDLDISLSFITTKLVNAILQMQPFGIGNPTPKFLSSGVLISIQQFGKTKNHTKLFIKDENNKIHEFVFFNSDCNSVQSGKEINFIYTLEFNEWGGKKSIRGKVISIVS